MGFLDEVLLEEELKLPEKELKDAYHTMDELYDHRTVLFATLCSLVHKLHPHCPAWSWKSIKHSDGSYEDGWFIAGINLEEGQVTYHQKIEYWDLFKCKDLEQAPKYDGHTSDDVLERLKNLIYKM